MDSTSQHPFLEKFSKDIDIAPESLTKAFEVERAFHNAVLKENDPAVRRQLYKEVYQKVHRIYGKGAGKPRSGGGKDRVITLFWKELYGKSILDVGCGEGEFLTSIASRFPTGELVGIDVSTDVVPSSNERIRFITSDIIEFELSDSFDVVFSDNVMEHIAPADVLTHLRSVKKVLKKNGTLIIIMPNRLFGPSDVTRIIDYTYSNRIEAMGTHLNESTYGEMISVLQSVGFRTYHTILPVPRLAPVFPNLRISAGMIALLERNAFVMQFLHALRYHSKCPIRLDIVLICSE